MTPPTPWLATFVNRWHSGASAPYLAHTQDRIGGHSGRMGVLALHYWPDCSRDLLVACLTHDLGEYAVADVPAHAKADPNFRAMLDHMEGEALSEMGMPCFSLNATDYMRLKFLDRLDAYLWARLHCKRLTKTKAWRGDKAALLDMALDLRVEI